MHLQIILYLTAWIVLNGILAIGKGISCIEKHFTLSKILKMEDYESVRILTNFSYVKIIKKAFILLGINSVNKNNFKLSSKEKII